ncbi:energy-coupling factor transport system ATP-binding protein [Caloramator fervidus]|uniref:ABC transporter ATP-binding protein n=1 Tax=Caloramator fervidus TaxID=29344 RepID=A0A1H5X7A4_9CLOT|nr:energy-coupling factor transporter ATPase [Caloramator fervidus]SEG07629.1 energy-coupling factor transport system ATP-binding protein [Caloramator fervidus]
MEIIKARNVYFYYKKDYDEEKKRIALNGIDIEIRKGEFIAIIGHNGSGKSTLAKHFNAILVPDEGDIIVLGINTKDQDKVWDVRKNVGMVFQNPDNQIVATIVEEDVAFGPENLGVPPEDIRKRVDEALKAVDMFEYAKHGPHLLSGGQKQRVAIAGVLAMKPSCIVLDEPTAMLDPSGRKEVMETIKRLNKEGITIVLITHFMEEAVEADRVIVMSDGKVVLDGTPREVFKNVSLLKQLGLDIPQMMQLAHELKKEGLNIREDILNIEEMVDALCQLKSKV